jgi:hypothetical protein
VHGPRYPHPAGGTLYTAASRAAAPLEPPAAPAVPDFTGAGVLPAREARALHHEVHDVLADAALQTLLDQIDDMPGIDAQRREWLRQQALKGVPAATLLDRARWPRAPRPRPNTGGR